MITNHSEDMGTRLDTAISFRTRLPSDDGYIQALSAGAFAEYARSGARAVRVLMFEEGAQTEMALLDDEPVGFVVVSFDRTATPYADLGHAVVAHLSAIASDPMMLRRGIGRRLLERAEEIARSENALCMSLTTGVSNLRARALFESAGYRSLAGVANFYGRELDAVFMHKPLFMHEPR